MEFKKYILKKSFRSPKHGTKENEPLKYKEFKEGDIVNGNYVDASEQGGSENLNTISIIITDNNWIIPFEYVMDYEESLKKKEKTMKTVVDKISEPINKQEFVKTDVEESKVGSNPDLAKKDAVKEIVNWSKKSVKGSLIGGGIGIAVAYFYNKNIWAGLLIGGISGGIIGSMIKTKPAENKNKLGDFINQEIKK